MTEPLRVESDVDKLLRGMSVEDILAQYTNGKIVKSDYKYMIREKAKLTLDDVFRENGYFKGIFVQMVKHAAHGWDNIVESASRDATPKEDVGADIKNELYYWGLAVIGQAQVMLAPLAAFGEANKAGVTRAVLGAGASPGFANFLGIIADIGSGFVPVGMTARGVTKGVQKLGQQFGKKTSESAVSGLLESTYIPKTQEEAAAIIAFKANKATEHELELAKNYQEFIAKQNRVELQATSSEQPALWKTFADSLEIDGVQNAEKLVQESAAVAGVTLPVIEKVVGAVSPNIVARSLKSKSQFLDDAAYFTKRVSKADAETAIPTLATKFGISLDEARRLVPTGGKPLTDRQLYGYLTALEAHVQDLKTLASQALVGSETDATQFVKYATDLFTAIPGDKPLYSKKFIDLLMHWDPENVARGDLHAAMKTFAQDMSDMTVENLNKFTLKNQDGFLKMDVAWWPMTKELYTNILLPFSWAPAFLGNSLATGMNVAERATGALFSADTNTGLVGREAFYEAKALMFATGDMIKAFGGTYKRMSSSELTKLKDLAAKGDGDALATLNEVSRLDYIPGAIPGLPGTIIRSLGAGVIGMDNAFKLGIKRSVMYAAAIREGVHRGLRGDELGMFIKENVENPNFGGPVATSTWRLPGAQGSFDFQQPIEWWKEAIDTAELVAFQNHLGALAEGFRNIAQNSPLFFNFPFVRNGVNVVKWAWDRSPGLQFLSGQLYKDMLAGGEKADMAIGRLTLSNLWSNFVYEMAKDGWLTGGPPIDFRLQKAWLATHEPYSVKTPFGYVPYTNMEPGTDIIGGITDFVQIADQLDEMSFGQGAMALTFAVGKNFADKTAWRTASDLIDVVQGLAKGEEVTTYARNLMLSPITSAATGGSVGPRIAKIIDPVQREARTYVDVLKSRTFWGSASLPPRRDGYLDPIVPPQAMGSSWFGLFAPLAPKFKEQTTDKIRLEGDRLQAKLPNYPWSIGGDVTHTRDEAGNIVSDFNIKEIRPGDKLGAQLTAQQRDRWQEIARNILRDPKLGIEAQLLSQDWYNDPEKTPAPLQTRMFEHYMERIKNAAGKTLLIDDTELGKKVMENIGANVMPLLSQDKKESTGLAIEKSINLFDSMASQQRDNLLKWGVLEPVEKP